MNQMNALHRYYIALALIAFILLVTGNAFAQRVSDLTPEQQRAQDIEDLRFMQKEVAKMRYSEFCATIPRLPPIDLLREIGAAAEKGEPHAKALMDFLMPVVERYNKNGCGDA